MLRRRAPAFINIFSSIYCNIRFKHNINCIAGDDNTAIPAPPSQEAFRNTAVDACCLQQKRSTHGARLPRSRSLYMRQVNLLTALGLAAMLLLAACHTTAGVGKDLSSAGG